MGHATRNCILGAYTNTKDQLSPVKANTQRRRNVVTTSPQLRDIVAMLQ